MRYREVIHTPLWLLAVIYFFFLSLVLSIWAALGNNAAILSFAALTLLLIFIYFKSALVIEADENELRVGNARISHEYIGQVHILTSQELGKIRTRDADPAAHLAIRFWATKAVQLMVNDQRDTTPYWLISTRHGAKLQEALKN
jgi:hypothetical protein